MTSAKNEVIINQPIAVIWDFVKEMDNWAPLVPGYISHEKVNERQSQWTFREDVGILKKKVTMLITIKEWIEPTKVTFDLKGINENMTGKGYFLAEALDKNKTKMSGYLEMTAEGPLAGIINAVLKTSVPKKGEEMTAAISAKLMELKPTRL
ncbi:SRPBCC family protein [Neobacillus sp. PS3-34]|uniref:CoxG family protein n=1 Tax=Neobacillus sp. PS3-34 TaxID=3070678 RepID=UPI0027DF3495|nr:SRPBCC family protein [Neobacillus sp. PS3-34]WML48754.1 SRPBCC family protein [Neobacillus sp. PS3-34]